MTGLQSVLYWLSALALAASFFLSVLGLVLRRSGVYRASLGSLVAGFLILTVFGIHRWVGTGHPPFVTLFESMICSVWFLLLIFVVLRARLTAMGILVLPVSGITFLLMGWSSSLPAEGSPLSAALTNVWLFIHASFATSGAAAFLCGAALSTVYLLGDRGMEALGRVVRKAPERSDLPRLIVNSQLLGLILWGVMIVSGSVWAHVAWGRYWAWDPIELWSLISWLLFGVLLHARLTFRIPHRTFCVLSILAAITVAFSLWGIHYVYETIHTYG
jgi:cytochrome c-type biogenesis protein CcsB